MHIALEWFYLRFRIISIMVIIPYFASQNLIILPVLLCLGTDVLYLFYQMLRKGLLFDVKILLNGIVILFWMLLIWSNGNFLGAERFVQFLAALFTYYALSSFDWRKSSFVFLYRVILFQLILFILWWPVTGFVTNYYAAFYSHGNFLGGMMLGYIAFLLLIHQRGYRQCRFSLALAFIILLLTNSRSALLATLILMVCLFFLNKLNSKKIVPIMIGGSIGVALTITIVYPLLAKTDLGLKLELLSRYLFNKNFFSGRQVIWEKVEDAIVKAPFMGYGLDKVPNDFFKTPYSAHNLWLQMSLQSGIPSILLLLSLLFAILRKTMSRNYWTWKITASLICAIILHECFEVSLTQNNLAIGLILWAVLGVVSSPKMKA